MAHLGLESLISYGKATSDRSYGLPWMAFHILIALTGSQEELRAGKDIGAGQR